MSYPEAMGFRLNFVGGMRSEKFDWRDSSQKYPTETDNVPTRATLLRDVPDVCDTDRSDS